jgi:hypothetical protein
MSIGHFQVLKKESCLFVSSKLASLKKKLLDVGGDCLRGGEGGVALHDLTLTVDEELLEVPLDASQAEDAGLGVLEELIHRVDVVTVHFNLHQKGRLAYMNLRISNLHEAIPSPGRGK